MRRMMRRAARAAFVAAIVTSTLANATAQQPRYGLYIGDRDTNRVITYLQPVYDPTQTDPALRLRWSCAYSQFARGYQSNPLEQIYIYGVAVDTRNRRIWASDHLRDRIVAFDYNGRYITSVDLPQGTFSPRKMTVGTIRVLNAQLSFLYVSAYNDNDGASYLLVYGPLESPTPRFDFFTDGSGQRVISESGVRFVVRGGQPHLLISSSLNGRPRAYRLLTVSGATSPNRGTLVAEWNTTGGEDIDYINDDHILLALNGGTIRRLRFADLNSAPDLVTGIPGFYIGIAVAPQETDGTQLVYVVNYGTFPNILYAYRYDIANARMELFGAASPLPYKSGYAIAVGPVWDCTQVSCPEDVTRDGIVDDADLLRILFSFGTRCGN